MKIFFKYFLLSQILLTFYFCGYAQVGIGTSNVDGSARLQVDATNKGFLPPRVALQGRGDAQLGSPSPRIPNPATGLLVYNTATAGSGATAVTPGFYYYDGFAWVRLIVGTDTAANVSGTVAVANGGTGATNITGILKGDGTNPFTAAVPGTDYQAPISGTINYLPKVTGTATVGNSQIFDNAISVGVGVNTPNAYAKLDVSSTTQGFLPPRMTYAQRISNLASPGSSAAGLIIFCTDCSSSGELQLFDGIRWVNFAGGTASQSFSCGSSTVTFTYRGASVTYGTVQGANSKCWLDRNLGAQRVATSQTDHLAYGDLFQWGRGDDGHQTVNWTSSTSGTGTAITTTLSSTNNPGHAFFISASAAPYNWRDSQIDNLWQGVDGANNVCPSGWRLPTEAELQAEIATWNGATARDKAFASVFKLPATGNRSSNASDTQIYAGESMWTSSYFLWTSTTSGSNSKALLIGKGSDVPLGFFSQHRAYGYTVRCIKD